MSVNFLTGVPGSGKTYFAVNELSKALEKRDRPIFTNINLHIPYNEVLKPFDVKDFHDFCSRELAFFDSYRNQQSELRKNREEFGEYSTDYIDEVNNSSDNYDEALKNSGILDKYGSSYIIWDECHNDLDRTNPVYVRWLSYHRHFEGMDVLLITQSLDLVDRKYKRFADKFYFGVNPAKRLFSTTFKYKVYTDHREYSKHLIEEISLPSNRKIFALYDSGHYKVNKSAAFKKLAPIFALVVFIALFTKYFLFGYVLGSNKTSEQQIADSSTVPSSSDSFREEITDDNRTLEDMKQDALNVHDDLKAPPPLVQGSSAPSHYDNQSSLSRHLIRFQCSKTYCYFSGNRFTIPLNSMERFLEEFNGKILSAEMLNRDISLITALVPSELYYMIESHNIVSRSDNYDPQSQKNNYNSGTLTAPQFSASTGI